MPLRRIGDVPSQGWGKRAQPCPDREHNPPNMIVLAPGVYEHTCPTCGAKKVFTVYPKFSYAGGA